MLAFRVTTGRYDDTQTYGIIVAVDEPTARYHLDRAQLAIARERRTMENSDGDSMPVLRMEQVELLNADVLVQRGDHDPAMPDAVPAAMLRGSVASS